MKKIFLVVTLMMGAFINFAQTSSRVGYIITTDTIRGTVVYREGVQATQICSFKGSGDSEARTYTPADIKGYGLESRHFVSIVFRGKQQFMEVIAKGRLSLLRSAKTYYLHKDTAFVALGTEKKITYIDGRRYESEDKVWLGRTKLLLADCASLAGKLDGIQLSDLNLVQVERRFSKIVATYNECTGAKTAVYALSKGKRSFSLGLHAGVGFPQITSSSSVTGNHTLTSTVSPIVGISLDYTNPRISERFRIRVEFSYAKADATDTDQYGVKRDVRYSTLRLPFIVHYSFNSKRISPFIRAGVAPSFFLDSEYTVTFNNLESEPSKLKPFIIPVITGLGVEVATKSKPRWFVEARYEWSAALFHDSYQNAKIGSAMIDAVVGLRF